jgi:putative ABC transport system permease protein
MRALLQDLRYGFRTARNNPGFTILAVLTLAVGIAVNTTVFSWIDTVLLRPIPGAAHPERLLAFESVAANGDPLLISYPDYRDYRDRLKLLDGLAVEQPNRLGIGNGADVEHEQRIWGELVSGNYFAVLGVRPELGRFFSRDEYGDKLGAYPVAVISDSLWRSRFQSRPNVLGSTIHVNRLPLTIVGVAPPEFRGSIPGLAFQMWVPVVMAPQLSLMPNWMLLDRQTRNLNAIARPQPGVTMEQARAEVAALAARMAVLDADTNQGIGATLLPLWKGHFGGQTMILQPLRLLMAVCGVVLLIVCANVANLLLARATVRRREFSVRMALGAGRRRLVRQLLTETLVLGLLGALAGAPLSMWLTGALWYLLPLGGRGLPVVHDIPLNLRILMFMIAVSIAVCLVSGLAPAWHTARSGLNDALKEGGRGGGAGSGSERLRGLLVSFEVALALVTIIGAGLFARSFQLASQINPGFDDQDVAVSWLGLSSAGYSVPQRQEFCRRLRARLESEPGIDAVSYGDVIPMGFEGQPWEPLRIEGYIPSAGENMDILRSVVAPGYFQVLRIPLLQGRDFTAHDDQHSNPVMIVNQTFVRRFFAGRDPVGRRVHGWGKWFTVIGVARDSKYRTPDEAARPYFYVPFEQVYRADLSIGFFIRAGSGPQLALAALHRDLRALDPAVDAVRAMPLADYITAALFPQKIAAAMLGVLGAVALLLASVGLYSVMAYSIAQRTREIGIRMALGARPADVLKLVLRQSMRLTLAGVAAGAVVALALTRLAGGLLVDVSATDPAIFAGAALFLAAVALVATWLPARRAIHIDPNDALRWG